MTRVCAVILAIVAALLLAVLRLGTGQVDAAHVGSIVEWLRGGVR